MNDHFDSKQEKIKQKLRWLWQHPEVTWSGTGVYVVSLVITAGLAAASWLLWPEDSPPPVPNNSISINGNNSGTAIVADGNVTVNGMSPEDAARLAEKLLVPLQGQLEAKDQQIKALTEAITALSKTGAPAASIEAALQALEQGDTAKAQAVGCLC